MADFEVEAADGTRLRAWRGGDRDGVPVLISNGLGTPPTAWPDLIRPGAGFDVVTWWHRGLGGSARPADPTRIAVADHTDDAEAVLDAADMPSALVVGWSLGVNVAFELEARRPDAVRGVLAVAGVPGGSFDSLFGPMGVPRPLRTPMGRVSARALRVLGPTLVGLLGALPRWPGLVPLIQDAAHAGPLVEVLREFAKHDWDWYSSLALAVADHPPMDTSGVRCPVTVVAGRWDAIAATEDVREFGRGIPGARVVELPGSHFVPLQFPAVMADEVRRLAIRAVR